MRNLLVLLFLLLPACLQAQPLTSDSLTRADLEALGVRFSDNNRVTLLESGCAKFDDMFKAIRQARHFIHLEYFNFRNDSIGHALFDLLGEKAKEGVHVRALFDGWGNVSNDQPLRRRHIDSIRTTGVEIHEFDPMCFPWGNHAFHRDHRKIVVIDGVMVYTGGMNVADYYLHGMPAYGEWCDMHMRIEGDAVTEYERIFRTMWAEVTGEWLDGPEFYPGEENDASALYFNGLKTDTTSTAGRKVIGVVDRIPLVQPKMMRRAYIAAIDNAQEHIQLVNPYPTMVRSVKRALYRALKRGVKVEFMVSSKSDIPVSPDVTALQMKRFFDRGADIYFYQPGFHHTKIMMVDGRYCTLGSANLNSRSMSWDYEVNAFVMDAATTAELSASFEDDKAKCIRLTTENWRKVTTRKQRILGRFYSLLTFIL